MATVEEIYNPQSDDNFPVFATDHGIMPDAQVRRLLNRKSTRQYTVTQVSPLTEGEGQTVQTDEPRTYIFRRSHKVEPVRVGDTVIIEVDKMENLTITKPRYFQHQGIYYGL